MKSSRQMFPQQRGFFCFFAESYMKNNWSRSHVCTLNMKPQAAAGKISWAYRPENRSLVITARLPGNQRRRSREVIGPGQKIVWHEPPVKSAICHFHNSVFYRLQWEIYGLIMSCGAAGRWSLFTLGQNQYQWFNLISVFMLSKATLLLSVALY